MWRLLWSGPPRMDNGAVDCQKKPYAQNGTPITQRPASVLRMQWNESYATGIPHLDQQHQTLFKAVAAMATAVATDVGASEYQRLLGFLDRYCRDHFAAEEGCMLRYRCPSAKKNRQQHEGLLQMLAQHRRFHTAHGYDPHDAQLLVHALQHWLHSHIVGVDRELWHCARRPLS